MDPIDRPDFSGRWTLNLKASSLSPVVAPVVQTGFVWIEHQEPNVSVHFRITMDGKTPRPLEHTGVLWRITRAPRQQQAEVSR